VSDSEIKKEIKNIFRMSGKLNLYVARIENSDNLRVKRELENLKKSVVYALEKFKN